MKFLCLDCDRVMAFTERQLPGDGTLAAVFACPGCGREMAMLANPMETQLVSSMGVKIGGREVPEQPLELVRTTLSGGREDAFVDTETDPPGSAAGVPVPSDAPAASAPANLHLEGDDAGQRVTWTPEALDRLGRVPSFVRGMVKRIYADYARERRVAVITPDVMDRARSDLGLEGM